MSDVTTFSAYLALQAAVSALLQHADRKPDLLQRLNESAADVETVAIFSRMSEADVENYRALVAGMRRLLQ